MAGFSELIKSFEKTREYIRAFFISGYKGRGDFLRKSSRTYDDEKRRAESWLNDVLRYDDSEHKRQISISVDCGHIYENPLYQVYGAKSFTKNDIHLHFLLLDVLAEGQAMKASEITEQLKTDEDGIEEQVVRNKLREYTAEGLLIAEKRGNAIYYRRSPDTADGYFSKYEGLADAVRFFSLDDSFGVTGAQLLKTAGLKNDLFLRKHHYIVHTLEDIVLPELLDAMAERSAVRFRNFSERASETADAAGCEYEAVPMQILTSVQTGRRYLAAYVPAQKRFHAFRLDHLRNVKRGAPVAAYDALAETYRHNLERVFGVSFGMRHEHGHVEPLCLTVRLDERTEGFILDRLYREKRIGTVQKIGEGRYTLTVDAFDPNEVMHWAKTLIGRIVSVTGGTEKVRERFYQDIRTMHRMYGGLPHDDVS